MTITVRTVAVSLFGLANAAAGGFFLWIEMQSKSPHSGHVYLFAGWIALGMGMFWPGPFFSTIKQIIVLIPLPDFKFGGMRKTDPQIPVPPGAKPGPPTDADAD